MEHRESIYVGRRFYDKTSRSVEPSPAEERLVELVLDLPAFTCYDPKEA